MLRATLSALALATATAGHAAPDPDDMAVVSDTMGEMAVPMPGGGIDRDQVGNTFRFEPIQNFSEMFQRDDVVFVMRHGPTDWSNLDIKDVAPGDCANQRLLSEQGHQDMRDFGSLLAFNDIHFSKIVVSEWCRNQQTLDEIRAGYDQVEPGGFDDIEIETRDDLNLLLSLQGAPNVTNLRHMVSTWEGGDNGPMLIITHFTNIQELTEFSVYEGESLIVDPTRDNRVLGYMRLRTAEPDMGHFDVSPSETEMDEDVAPVPDGP